MTAKGGLAAGVVLAAALAACDLSPPDTTPSRLAPYYGEWTGPNARLVVTPSHVDLTKTGGILDTAILRGQLHGLRGNNLVFGRGRRSRIEVQVPPHRVGNVWKMTVEGVEVQRR